MSVKVVVRPGEPLAAALSRLNVKLHHAYKRQVSKTRLGAYEKPSYRKRKAAGNRHRNARIAAQTRKLPRQFRCTVFIGLRLLLSRTEVYQASRAPFKPHRRHWKDRDE